MHISSAAFYVYAGNGLVPLVLIISSFVLLNVTGMVRLVAVTLLTHHTEHHSHKKRKGSLETQTEPAVFSL